MAGDIYLDNATTSWPKPPGVLEAMKEFLERAGGGPGRAGHHRSIETSRGVSLAREHLAELLGVEVPDEIAFTKNATEGLNVAIHGLAPKGGRIVTTSLEHNSVMRPLRFLEQRGDCTIEIVHADGNTGEIDLDDWTARLRAPGQCLAVAVHASNVTGALLPVEKMGAIASEAGVPFVVDASQSGGHVPLSLPALNASAVALPGHKGLLGPMGTGVLYFAEGVEVPPLMQGGTGSRSEFEYQPDFAPDRYESGTLNAIGVFGLGAAAEHLLKMGVDKIQAHLADCTVRFRDGLSGVGGVTMQGPSDPAAGVGIVSLNIDGVPCATVARLIDDEWGIMTRAGLHCSPAAHRSLGTAPDGTIRFAFGETTTDDEIDVAVNALRQIAAKAREAQPARQLA